MLARCSVWVVMVVSGAVFALRALAGPLTAPIKVGNPVIPEAWFSMALLFTMLITADGAHGNSNAKAIAP